MKKGRFFCLTTFKTGGYIKKLYSNNHINSNYNELVLDVRKFGIKMEIKFHLRSEEYKEAIEAHKKHKIIEVSGKAKKLKTIINITELESFCILT